MDKKTEFFAAFFTFIGLLIGIVIEGFLAALPYIALLSPFIFAYLLIK